MYPIQCSDSGAWPHTAGTPEHIHHHFLYLYRRNSRGLSGTDDLGCVDSFLWKSKCDPGHLHSHGAGSFRMHARAGILYSGKRLRRYRSFEGFRLPFPCGNLSKRRIPKIRGIRYLLLDRTYHVPDGPSVFRYQPAETPGDDDNTVFCGNDRTVACLLRSGQQADTETGQEKDDSVCLCCFQPCIFLHRLYGKHPVHPGSRTGPDSDSRGSTSHGDFRYSAAGGCRRYCTERCGYLGKQPRGNVLRSQNFRLQAGAEPFHADLYGGLHHWKRQWSRIPDCGIRCSCILRRRRTDTDVLR